MNSLNILSARVSPPTRNNPYGNMLSTVAATESRNNSQEDILHEKPNDPAIDTDDHDKHESEDDLMRTASLDKGNRWDSIPYLIGLLATPRRVAFSFIESVRWLVSTLAAPGVYLVACLYDDKGMFSPFSGAKGLGSPVPGRSDKLSTKQSHASSYSNGEASGGHHTSKTANGQKGAGKWTKGASLRSSKLSSSSESDMDRSLSETEQHVSTARHNRSKSSQIADEIAPARRSIRIKLHNEETLRQRKHRKSQSSGVQSNGSGIIAADEISPATLKSPTSPAASLHMTKYPRAPAPPRPLIPRRQPSYTINDAPRNKLTQKTLILDLDETLIHSMAKGGRMGTGHMVEVKLNTVVGPGGNNALGPQHPILYYVHKRPHCDDFLRRVCRWYNLVIFTASVQEYADPVIDWLEQERKFFSGRYYRQHCTYRHGAFIKDLSSVEPDLSKVMILDNSPLSYMFHQDNAIPIEGWINDPTDNDLLYLVPLLEGLQYVTDVRAFLALRGGEDGKHI